MSTIRRQKRNRAEMGVMKSTIYDLCEAFHPRTIRGLFYQLIAQGIIAKDQREYVTVSRTVVNMRQADELPWEWIVDETRVSRKPNTWDKWDELADDFSASVRWSFWKRETVQVWCEKSTVSGLIHPITDALDVAFATVNGQSSVTFLHKEAQKINERGLPAHIYLFGDYDPSGNVSRMNIISRIRKWAPDVNLTFYEAAITREQVSEFNLPTRPTKTERNPHAKSRHWNDGDDSVELDALPPDILVELVKINIMSHIDPKELEAHRKMELQLQDAVKKAILALPAPAGV